MDLTGMSPFRNAQYTPSVPVQHGMYGQMPGVQNVYLDDIGQVSLLPQQQDPFLPCAPTSDKSRGGNSTASLGVDCALTEAAWRHCKHEGLLITTG